MTTQDFNHIIPSGKELKFVLGEENRVYIEDDIHDSQLFSNQYTQLRMRIAEYVSPHKSFDESNACCNMFAINGERGAGKTSVMLSFKKFLLEGSDNSCRCGNYYSIDTIDPSFFNKNANILQIVVAHLYNLFSRNVEDRQSNLSLDERNALLSSFTELKRCLDTVDGKNIGEWGDDLESLGAMADAVNLRSTFHDLITKILKLERKSFFLLTIDDIDLNTDYAYEMVEQIRKYLTLPNVVILLAVKMNQLQQVLNKHFANEFSSLRNLPNMQTAEDVVEMSVRYLLKLIPLENRVDLHDMSLSFDKKVMIEKDGQTIQNGTLSEVVLETIKEKTGYVFLKRAFGLSYILPRNLRALRLLVKMLYNMDSLEEKKPLNRQLFQDYFMNEWLRDNLSVEDSKIILDLYHIEDASLLSKCVVTDLMMKIKDTKDSAFTIFKECPSYNISMGDAFTLLIRCQDMLTEEEDQKFIFAIKTIYTFRLEEAYQRLIDKSYVTNLLSEYKSSDPSTGLYASEYQRLVEGGVLNGFDSKLLPSPASSPKLNRFRHSASRQDWILQKDAVSELFMLLTFVGDAAHQQNPGEEYRKRREVYYSRSLKNTQNVLIDWFNILYSVPFFIAQYSRFFDTKTVVESFDNGDFPLMMKLWCHVLNDSGDGCPKLNSDTLSDWYKKTCVHSAEVAERLYMNVRDNNYSIDDGNALSLYDKMLDKMRTTANKCECALYLDVFVTQDLFDGAQREDIIRFLESAPDELVMESTPRHKLSYPKIDSIRSFGSINALKARMWHINMKYGYSAEWLDKKIDDLEISVERMQSNPAAVYSLLKTIKR